MNLLKIRLFIFVLFCIAASVVSINFEPSVAAQHHGKGVPCNGRRGPRPNAGRNDTETGAANEGIEGA